MTLTDRAVIELDLGERTGVFEVSTDLEPETTVNHSYLIGNAGQRLGEAIRFIGDAADQDLGENEPRRRRGFTLDAGAGEWTGALSFSAGLSDVQWGDGSGGTGPANVTEYDASGADVGPITRMHVMQYWFAKTLTDSRGKMRIHHGEWTDGTVLGGVEPGVYGRPKTVSLLNADVRSPADEPNNIRGTINYRRTDTVGLPDEVADAIEPYTDALADAVNNDPQA